MHTQIHIMQDGTVEDYGARSPVDCGWKFSIVEQTIWRPMVKKQDGEILNHDVSPLRTSVSCHYSSKLALASLSFVTRTNQQNGNEILSPSGSSFRCLVRSLHQHKHVGMYQICFLSYHGIRSLFFFICDYFNILTHIFITQALIRKWAPVAIVIGVVFLLFWAKNKIW